MRKLNIRYALWIAVGFLFPLTNAGAQVGNGLDAHKARIADYWTKERKAAAIPRDLVIDPRGLGYLKGRGGVLVPYGHDLAIGRAAQTLTLRLWPNRAVEAAARATPRLRWSPAWTPARERRSVPPIPSPPRSRMPAGSDRSPSRSGRTVPGRNPLPPPIPAVIPGAWICRVSRTATGTGRWWPRTRPATPRPQRARASRWTPAAGRAAAASLPTPAGAGRGADGGRAHLF